MARAPFTLLSRETVAAAKELYEGGATIAATAAGAGISTVSVSRYAKLEGWRRPGAGKKKKSISKDAKAPTKALPQRASLKRSVAAATKPALGAADRAAPSKARARSEIDDAPTDPGARRAALIARLHAAVERQVSEVEKRLGAHADDVSSEREARALAVLVRLLKELDELEGPAPQQLSGAAAREDEDVEAAAQRYSAELARLIDSLRERRREHAGTDPANATLPEDGAEPKLGLPGA
ncbi:hypothetical protein [Terrarubrum flagellatum]|uniref:hypothetical protein n=1 Tax=Terrirubrum flagellatum TaxID=2895980 RepID=UPI00314532D1